MKITTDHKKTFQPVNVTITFESEEELLAVRAMFGGMGNDHVKDAIKYSDFPDADLEYAVNFKNNFAGTLITLVRE